jgi:HK97 family phage prohead protease
MPATTVKHYTVPAVKPATEELKALKGEDADVVAYASVEVEDRDRDIVRVAGISLKNHTDASPVKLFASHLRSLPNGESPVIGRVLRFARVKHGDTGQPALAFAAKFAGTPLGKHYKGLYGDGDQTDFSIGFRVHKAEPLGKDKGFDFTETELMEVSCVALPANAHASAMKALEETYPEAKPADNSEVISLLKSIQSRLDDLEDTFYAGKAKGDAAPLADHTEAAESDKTVSATFDPTLLLAALNKALGGK